ncbi:MAG TPA: RodZ domain-containing protein [Dissulfurispiraceae bacterium]|nr:RodZ domain-containing protein [Dissulfurispiraceae bacterium]
MSKLFRKKREELGRDISEVAAATRIKETSLAAIEEEDYDKLPIEVYARGYIREYAKYLGVPADEGLASYKEYIDKKIARKEPNEPRVHETAATPPVIDKIGRKEKPADVVCQEAKVEPARSRDVGDKTTSKSGLLWKAILLIVVLGAVSYQFISTRNAEKEPTVATMFNQQAQPAQETPVPPPDQTVPQQTVNSGDVRTTETPPEKKRHELVISAKEPAWVQVIADGSEKKEALMKAGESLNFVADESISLIVGNAGGVSLNFDGQVLPAGKEGAVLRLTLPVKPKAERPAGESSAHKSSKKPVAKPSTETADGEEDGNPQPEKMSEQSAPSSKP